LLLYENISFKLKIAGNAAIFFILGKTVLFAFYHCAYAFCAKQFLHGPTIFNYRYFLQVRFKNPVGRSLRKTAIMTKNGSLATSFTLRHFYPFPYILPFWVQLITITTVVDFIIYRIFFQETML